MLLGKSKKRYPFDFRTLASELAGQLFAKFREREMTVIHETGFLAMDGGDIAPEIGEHNFDEWYFPKEKTAGFQVAVIRFDEHNETTEILFRTLATDEEYLCGTLSMEEWFEGYPYSCIRPVRKGRALNEPVIRKGKLVPPIKGTEGEKGGPFYPPGYEQQPGLPAKTVRRRGSYLDTYGLTPALIIADANRCGFWLPDHPIHESEQYTRKEIKKAEEEFRKLAIEPLGGFIESDLAEFKWLLTHVFRFRVYEVTADGCS